MSTDAAWRDVILALLGSWPGRLDQMTATAFVHELIARGVTDPQRVLRAIREMDSEHPPSASTLANAAAQVGQDEPPSFGEMILFVARTLSRRTAYGSTALGSYVRFVADRLHEAPARWIAEIGMTNLRSVPDERHALDATQRARLADFKRGYAGVVADWRVDPTPGHAVVEAQHRDELEAEPRPWLAPVREIGSGGKQS